MADKKITELNELSSPQANDLIPIVNVTTGETQKVKYSNIASNVDLSSYATISYVDGLIENVDSFTETVLFDTDITLDASKIYIEKNSNSSARSLTIPSANSGNLGKFIFVYKSYNNGYNINCGGGGVSCTLKRDADSVLYISDGYSWKPHLNISNELLLSLTTKEPTIASGTTSQYWRGDKTWQTFPTISTPTLDEVTDAGNTTTNSIEVGGLVVDMPSGLGVAVEITKGGNGEALTVNKTSGSGNVASFNNGTTLVKDLEVSTATANRPAFFDSAKKLVIATGALLGTWFQTLTAKTTPIGADTIIVNDSASSFEAKKTTLTELWTNYLRAFVFATSLTTNRILRWNGTQLTDGIIEDDGGGLVYTRGISTGYSIKNNAGTIMGWLRYYNTIDTMTYLSTGASNVMIGHEPSDSTFFISSGVVSAKFNVFEFKNNTSPQTRFGRFTIDGLAIGSSTINASAQLDLQSTTKGLGLNRVPVSDPAGSTGRNGLLWYDDTNHLFKGTQNGGTVNLLSGSGLTTNTIPRANAGSLEDSYIQEITTIVATRPYPSVSIAPSGTGSGQSGFLKWVDNGSNLGELYIYKPYTNGQGPGWYQILTNQNTAFPVLSTSSPAIGMGLSAMTNSTSTAPTNLYTGEIRNLRVGSQLYGLGVFQGGAGFHYLKPFGGNHWEFSVAVNSYMRDWDWEIIGATANSGKGGGNNTLSNLSKIGNSTVKFRAMANTNSPYYYVEGVFKVNSSGAITSLVITQPSSNTAAFNVSITDTRIQFTGNAFSLAYVICEKIGGVYYGDLYNTPYENERYSADATVKYWAGSGGLALGTSTINASAQLDLQSTTKGFLPNRMTNAQRTAITSPVAGLLVYQTDAHSGFWLHDGTTWQDLSQSKTRTTTSSATPTINTDVTDYYEITDQTVDITSFTTNLTGTPVRGQKLWIDITGTAARAITWGASFEASTIALPTTTVGTSKLSVGFIWNVATSKWRCVGVC